MSTNPPRDSEAATPDAACAVVEALRAHETVWIPGPTPRHAGVFAGLLRRHGVTGNFVPDAGLAALAVQHGLTVCSADADFARFTEVRWLNPLAR